MIRNLKVLLAAALALTAFGALGVAGAHAEDAFHCNLNPCRGTLLPDGTGATAHHVFIIENEATTESVSFTCASLSGEGELVGNEAAELTVKNLAYNSCKANGSAGVTVKMNTCDYLFTGAGGRTDEAEVHVSCTTPGDTITIEYNGCIVHIGELRAKGIGYKNEGSPGSRVVTATVNHVTIPANKITITGTKAQCLINPSQPLVGTYTTGNTLVTGEENKSPFNMADAWYE